MAGRPDQDHQLHQGRTGRDAVAIPNRRTHIPIDASVDLPMDNPIAEVTAGDLIGELAALAALKQERLKRPKFYPRSATVRAKTDVVVLEMLPNILNNVLYNAPAFKDKLNKNYRYAGARQPSALGADLPRSEPGVPRLSARSGGTGGRGARPGHLPPGRYRRFVLPHPHGIREGLPDLPGRRTGADLSFAQLVFRRDGPAAAGVPRPRQGD